MTIHRRLAKMMEEIPFLGLPVNQMPPFDIDGLAAI